MCYCKLWTDFLCPNVCFIYSMKNVGFQTFKQNEFMNLYFLVWRDFVVSDFVNSVLNSEFKKMSKKIKRRMLYFSPFNWTKDYWFRYFRLLVTLIYHINMCM